MISIKQLLSPATSPELRARLSNERSDQEFRISETRLPTSGSLLSESLASHPSNCQAARPHSNQVLNDHPPKSEDIIVEKDSHKNESFAIRRAAQNRAAQRAFRQRKEKLIQKLEQQAEYCKVLDQNCQSLQAENNQLREYMNSLEIRIMQVQNDFPVQSKIRV